MDPNRGPDNLSSSKGSDPRANEPKTKTQLAVQRRPVERSYFVPTGGFEAIKPKDKGLLKAWRRLWKAGLIKWDGYMKTETFFEACPIVEMTPANIIEKVRELYAQTVRSYPYKNRFVILMGDKHFAVFREFTTQSPLHWAEELRSDQRGPSLLGMTIVYMPEIEGTLMLPADRIIEIADKLRR